MSKGTGSGSAASSRGEGESPTALRVGLGEGKVRRARARFGVNSTEGSAAVQPEESSGVEGSRPLDSGRFHLPRCLSGFFRAFCDTLRSGAQPLAGCWVGLPIGRLDDVGSCSWGREKFDGGSAGAQVSDDASRKTGALTWGKLQVGASSNGKRARVTER